MADPLTLENLAPDPREEWRRLLRFVGWSEDDRQAAARSVEILLQRAHELVVSTYDHLSGVPETAAILGWEDGPDSAHLEERRRFFTIWLARTLGLDTSDELALYLFRAGLQHAGLGPRRVQVAPEYVTASIGLVQASFARYLAEAGLPSEALGPALGAWSRYLSVQLDLMLAGYRAARDLTAGSISVRCAAYGRLRSAFHRSGVSVAIEPGDPLAEVLRKLFNAYPEVRAEVLDRVWEDRAPGDSLWTEVVPTYVPRPGWRLLLNGRDIRYEAGLQAPVASGDEVSLFPPGR